MLADSIQSRGKREYPPCPAGLPVGVIDQGRYRARFARSTTELDEILRLRFQVFNLELGEGLEASFATQRDEDAFDQTCHHLLVEDRDSGAIIGTYRFQTGSMAAAGSGFYSSGEFDLTSLPYGLTDQSLELGRACIAREHRNRTVLFLLWRGLARYMETNRLRYLFGCCSLTSQDPIDGLQALAYLERKGQVHPSIHVDPQPGFACPVPSVPSVASVQSKLTAREERFSLPMLFRTYLRYGGLVCGHPAIDREFKTIDFFLLFDLETLDAKKRAVFFGR